MLTIYAPVQRSPGLRVAVWSGERDGQSNPVPHCAARAAT